MATPLSRLAALERFGMKLGLETMRSLSDLAGSPERACPVLHVAGTNGKGSVAAMLAAALRAGGFRVGLYSSPHLVELGERFQIDGTPTPAEALEPLAAWALALDDTAQRREGRAHPATFFEISTLMAFEQFRREGVTAAVIETGLGGRFDATNIVSPRVAVITSIALDHTRQLGRSIVSIAREKAGIIKPDVPVVTGPLPPTALRAVREAATRAGAPLVEALEDTAVELSVTRDGQNLLTLGTPHRSYGPLQLGLRGRHQAVNAAIAVRALETAGDGGLSVAADAIERGLRTVRWPGRLDLVRLGARSLLLDGAHNAAGAEALARYLDEIHPDGVSLVFGCSADKDARAMLDVLARRARRVICTEALSARAAKASALARIAATLGVDVPIDAVPDPAAATRAALASPEVVCVAGSLFLIGDVARGLGLRLW